MKIFVLFSLLFISIDKTKSQYTLLYDKIHEFDNEQGFNQRNSDYNYNSPLVRAHYVNRVPIEEDYYRRPVPHQYYDEHEEYSPIKHQDFDDSVDYKSENEGLNHGNEGFSHGNEGYSRGKEEKIAKGSQEGGHKKFKKLDQHSDKGHKKHDLVAKSGYHDQHDDGTKALVHNKFGKDAEYSHDRGHGFIKAWSWDRVNHKKALAGEMTKKLDTHSSGNRGGHKEVAKHDSQAHDQKDLKKLKGNSGYKKIRNEERERKSHSNGKLDYDNRHPVYG